MDSSHLSFPQLIHASRPIDTLLRLRTAATLTLVERECFLESAEQAGLRRCSTVRQQERGSRRQFFFQVRQDLLNDHRVFDAGNHLRGSSAYTAGLNVYIENPLEPLRPGHRRMTSNWRLFALTICVFGLATLAPLRRGHQCTVFAVRGEYTVKSRQVDPGLGHKSC